MSVADKKAFSTSAVACLRSRPTLTKDSHIKTATAQRPKQQHLKQQQVLATSHHVPQGPAGQQTVSSLHPQPQHPSQQVVINQYTSQTTTNHNQSFQLHHTHTTQYNHTHHNNTHASLLVEPYPRPRRRSTSSWFSFGRAHKDYARYVALLKSQAKYRQQQLQHLQHQQHHHQQHQHHHHREQHHRHKSGHHHHHHHHGHHRHQNPYNDPYYNFPWQHWYQYHYKRRPFKALAIGAVLGISGYTLYSESDLHQKLQQLQSLVNQGYLTSLHFKAATGIPSFGSSAASGNSSPATSSPSSPFDKSSPAPAQQHPQSSPFQKQQVRMLTQEQVNQNLAKNQKSFKLHKDDGKKKGPVVGYCINQLASNNPIEDDLSKHVVRGKEPSEDQIFFGVFDGHGGWCCSQKVAQELAPHVAAELSLVSDRSKKVEVIEAIERGFLNLDEKVVNDAVEEVLANPTRALATSALLPAISGSCALLAYIDSTTRDLYVACVGDSRAVLGVKEKHADGSHTWKAVPLSYDQTGRTRTEVLRMREEHPGEEETVIMRGRVLGGLEPTRAFGDARYKWSRETQDKVFKLFPAYRQPNAYLKTPPYVTAKPVVQHHKLQPEDAFLVMATDGLWDKLTSDEVVQLVGDLLDGKTGVEKKFLDRAKANIKQIDQELTPTNLKPKGPESQIRQFTFRDRTNASTHLIRNALGGADEDKVAATLAIPSPMSRVYRDDITVTVVFFSEQDTKETLMEALEIDGLIEI